MTTLYLDTSSLLKIYVVENGSDEVLQELGGCAAAATCAVAYPEARAAFARRRRDGTLSAAAYRAGIRDFDADWSRYLVIEPSMTLCRSAGELAERYALRGFDSLHLATFLQLARHNRSDVHFSSFDRQLNRAAIAALRRQRRSRV